jgi:hypothetical protein
MSRLYKCGVPSRHCGRGNSPPPAEARRGLGGEVHLTGYSAKSVTAPTLLEETNLAYFASTPFV